MSDDPTEGEPSVAARDDLAGVVDLFGALTRSELADALSELAFKRRTAVDEGAIERAIDAAVAEYYLVPAPADAVVDPAADPPDGDLLSVGPVAFPSLPANAADLPHILDVPDREVDRERLAAAVFDRLYEDAVAAMADGDAERLETLLDVAYDVEAWAPVDTAALRDRIVDELE